MRLVPGLPCAVFLASLSALGVSARAFAVVSETDVPEIFDTAYLFQVFGSLILVFGCLFGLAFLVRKLNGVPVSDRKLIQIVGSAKVGTREKIVLLKAGEQELLVGVAAGSVRTLYVFGDAEEQASTSERQTRDDFASVLKSSGSSELVS